MSMWRPCRGHWSKDLHEIQGMRLRLPVQAGSTVVREDFERGAGRRSTAADPGPGGLSGIRSHEAHGLPLAKGNAGEIVPVLVDNAEAPVRARVIDKGEVQVVQ